MLCWRCCVFTSEPTNAAPRFVTLNTYLPGIGLNQNEYIKKI
jgi:hypothetical protein